MGTSKRLGLWMVLSCIDCAIDAVEDGDFEDVARHLTVAREYALAVFARNGSRVAWLNERMRKSAARDGRRGRLFIERERERLCRQALMPIDDWARRPDTIALNPGDFKEVQP